MKETKRTVVYIGVAVVLLALAFLASPRRIVPGAFQDQGQAFFAGFTDPNEATSLEIVSYDAATSAPKPFKVMFKNGRWTIPSHHDYPADAKDRLAKTAAGVIDILRDDYRTDNAADYESMGVVDPMEEGNGSPTGRGTHVTFRGRDDNILADFIIGQTAGEGGTKRFVRKPGEKRVYAVKMNVDLSGKFEDWIDRDLLMISKSDIDRVILKDYSVNERTSSVEQHDVIDLTEKDGNWKANKMGGDQIVDSAKMQGLLTALDELSIVGVRTKPSGLSRTLQGGGGGSISQQDMLSLQSKGFYIGRDGQIVSNEGELQVRTKKEVSYVLRFGEVAHGTGDALTAGLDGSSSSATTGPAENRYLFVTASYDANASEEPKKPSGESFRGKPDSLLTPSEQKDKTLSEAHERWQSSVDNARKSADEINARFANWYYVISSTNFDKVHLKRSELVVKKK